jgi:hypothetical protein
VSFRGWLAMALPGRALYLQATFEIENAMLTYPCCMN